MKDMTKIFERAVKNAPKTIDVTNVKDLKEIILKCANVLEFVGEDKATTT